MGVVDGKATDREQLFPGESKTFIGQSLWSEADPMRLTTLFLLATLVAISASAASYQKTYGTIVDPIWNWYVR
jgi:hypothetical protein